MELRRVLFRSYKQGKMTGNTPSGKVIESRFRHRPAIPNKAPTAVKKLVNKIPLARRESVSRKFLTGDSIPIQNATILLPVRRNSNPGCVFTKEVASSHFSCM